MKPGSDRKAKDQPRRRAGNLYKRLEEAREQRAKILATPNPANKPTPVEARVVPARVVPEKKSLGRKRLPRLKPAGPDLAEEPVLDIEPVVAPRQRSSWLMWHAAIVIVLLAGAFALTTETDTSFTVATETASMTAPEATGQPPVLPAATSTPEPQDVSELAATTPDPVPTRPVIEPVPTPEVQFEAPVALSAISDERPRQNPRADSVVERTLPPELGIASIEEDGFDIPAQSSTPLKLRPSVNLPRTVTDTTTRDVSAKLEALGLEWDAPKYFSFNVNQTQVRYFHDTDKADAERLAEAFGATLRDFTEFQPLPPEGRVELWVAGRSAPRQQSTDSALGDVRRDLRQLGTDLQGAIRSITRNR